MDGKAEPDLVYNSSTPSFLTLGTESEIGFMLLDGDDVLMIHGNGDIVRVNVNDKTIVSTDHVNSGYLKNSIISQVLLIINK